jgi:2-phosphosulfolactate phosphatase
MNVTIKTTLGSRNLDINLKEYIVILIDVLRASSTITTLFKKNAKAVHSLKDLEDTYTLKNQFKDNILIGERYGIKIKDFDLGNSPYHIYNLDFTDKEIIFTSSNFSRVLTNFKDAKMILVGCILNARAVALYIKEVMNSNDKILLVEVGTAENFSIEDNLGARIISNYLIPSKIPEESEIEEILLNSPNGKYLSRMGYKKDVIFCSQLNRFDCVPIRQSNYTFGVIH